MELFALRAEKAISNEDTHTLTCQRNDINIRAITRASETLGQSMRAFSIPLRFSFDPIHKIQQLSYRKYCLLMGQRFVRNDGRGDTQSHVRHNTEHMSRTPKMSSTDGGIRKSSFVSRWMNILSYKCVVCHTIYQYFHNLFLLKFSAGLCAPVCVWRPNLNENCVSSAMRCDRVIWIHETTTKTTELVSKTRIHECKLAQWSRLAYAWKLKFIYLFWYKLKEIISFFSLSSFASILLYQHVFFPLWHRKKKTKRARARHQWPCECYFDVRSCAVISTHFIIIILFLNIFSGSLKNVNTRTHMSGGAQIRAQGLLRSELSIVRWLYSHSVCLYVSISCIGSQCLFIFFHSASNE